MGENMPSPPSTPPTSNTSSSLPDKSSPSLTLTHPTPSERLRTWSLTHHLWGAALSHDDYVAREAYLTTVPLAKDGGLAHWILTDPSLPPDERPILSSCESLRKRAVYARPDGVLVEGIVHGIGSVFTDPQYRGRGYAGRMMQELGPKLRGFRGVGDRKRRNSEPGEEVLFSVLYSDIGKEFYARKGWKAYPSGHVRFKPGRDGEGLGGKARGIGYHELAELCCVDERLVREGVVRRARETGRGAVAVLPELDQLLWHLMREDYMTKRIFGRTPEVRGAVWGEVGGRVWAVWTRAYYNTEDLEKREGNIMHLLRVVVEDEERMGEEEVREGFREVLGVARREADEWKLGEVQMWNVEGGLRRAVEGCGVEYKFVEREKDSIASLMWYGQGDGEVEWFANEKYAWC